MSPLSIRASLATPGQAFVGQGLFFTRVEFGAFAGEAGSGEARDGVGKRGLDGLASIGEAPGGQQSIHPFEQVRIDRDRDFGLWHGGFASMIHHHTSMLSRWGVSLTW